MTGRYPLLVAARVALAFFVRADFIFLIDSDTAVMANPFPALFAGVQAHPGSVLFGVQDVAARGDQNFMQLLDGFRVVWERYQQAAVLLMRTGPVLIAEIRAVYRSWAAITRVLHFAEQDALAIWFSPELKAMLPDAFNRQWADCGVGKNDTVVRLICHGRWGIQKTWPQWRREMRDAGIAIGDENESIPGL
jgi:hypothetical protein